jgi:hypothetical protein
VGVQIHRGAQERPDRRRCEVDGRDAGIRVPGGIGLVGLGRGRLEHQVGHIGLLQQPVDATGARLHAQLLRTGQAVRRRVDPDHVANLDVVAAQELDQQVGPDVAGADNRRSGFACGWRLLRAGWVVVVMGDSLLGWCRAVLGGTGRYWACCDGR